MYLPAASQLKTILGPVDYSTLKLKWPAFYRCHLVFCFAFSQIHQLSPHRVNKDSNLMVEPGILLPLPCQSWFLHFLYKVAVHPYQSTGEYFI